MPKHSQKKRAKAAAATAQVSQVYDETWQEFGSAVAKALSDLDDDEFLIILVRKSDCFVQFAGQKDGEMRAEAQSNTFIEKKRFRLSKAKRQLLLSMGWNKPTYVPSRHVPEPKDGSCNYYLDAAAPVSFESLATLGINTLRQIYGVLMPSELTYAAFSRDGNAIRLPSLGIARHAPDSASPQVEGPTNEEREKPAAVGHRYVFYPIPPRIH